MGGGAAYDVGGPDGGGPGGGMFEIEFRLIESPLRGGAVENEGGGMFAGAKEGAGGCCPIGLICEFEKGGRVLVA